MIKQKQGLSTQQDVVKKAEHSDTVRMAAYKMAAEKKDISRMDPVRIYEKYVGKKEVTKSDRAEACYE